MTPGIIAAALVDELGPAAIPVIVAVVLAAGASLVAWSRRRRAEGSPHW
jgi:predicted MFS family arabinose efflux permease